jgi:regulator of protease activity HflC (stomatin/prohibitin superfamily)
MYPFESVAGVISLRVQSLNASCDTKTKDNVFVKVNINVQYQAIREKVYSAFYVLSEHEEQMR